VKVNRNAKGQRQAKTRAEKYLLPYFRNVPAEKVTRDHLRMYRSHLEALTTMKGKVKKPLLTAQTVRHILADARCLFLWAADSGRISASPVPRRLLPKMAESQPRALEPDEQAKVAAVEEPYGLAVRLMIGTGVRWSELCRLQASDVRGGELVVQGETKTKKMRHVPVPPALLAELKNRVGKLVPFEAKDDPSFNRSVRFRCPDVPDFSAHRCRHSFAVNYLTAGGNIRALQLMMGHASLATTEIYMKVSQGMVRDDARRVVGWNPGA